MAASEIFQASPPPTETTILHNDAYSPNFHSLAPQHDMFLPRQFDTPGGSSVIPEEGAKVLGEIYGPSYIMVDRYHNNQGITEVTAELVDQSSYPRAFDSLSSDATHPRVLVATVAVNETHMKDHLKGHLLYPGNEHVRLAEAVGEVILKRMAMDHLPAEATNLDYFEAEFVGAESIAFKGMVVPGQTVEARVRIESITDDSIFINTTHSVDGNVVATIANGQVRLRTVDPQGRRRLPTSRVLETLAQTAGYEGLAQPNVLPLFENADGLAFTGPIFEGDHLTTTVVSRTEGKTPSAKLVMHNQRGEQVAEVAALGGRIRRKDAIVSAITKVTDAVKAAQSAS